MLHWSSRRDILTVDGVGLAAYCDNPGHPGVEVWATRIDKRQLSDAVAMPYTAMQYSLWSCGESKGVLRARFLSELAGTRVVVSER